MSKATISRESAIQGLLSLGVNVDWNAVNPDVFQKTVIEDPVETGRRFTDFLNNGCQISVVPPSIFPDSLNGSDNAIYFLVSRAFVSHETRRKNFNESSETIAFLTYGCFSCF